MSANAESQAIVLRNDSAITRALDGAGFLAAIREDKANLVTPAVYLDKVPALHRLAVRAVTWDLEEETYDAPGKPGQVCPGATALQKVSKAAQLDWEKVERIDPEPRDPYRVTYQAYAIVTNLDSTRSRLIGSPVTVDLRGEPGWPA